MSNPPLTSKNWFGKTAAGVILGFALALGLSGLFRISGGIEEAFFSTRGQVAMWMMAPIWALILSFVFMFRTTTRAWGWLLVANVIVWGAIVLTGGLNI